LTRIHVEAENCSGCRYCEMLCSFYHDKKFSPKLSRIRVIKVDNYGLDYPVTCRQCDSCPPSDICPTKAFTKTKEGVFKINEEACTACQRCVAACTFKAVRTDESSKPLVCDLCGGNPLCVKRCPTKALKLAESVQVENPEEAFERLLRRWGIHG